MDLSTKDNEGLKPVDLAKENNHEEAYQLLFKVARPSLLVRFKKMKLLKCTFDLEFHVQ